MSLPANNRPFSQMAEELEAKAKAVRQLEEILVRYPDLADQLSAPPKQVAKKQPRAATTSLFGPSQQPSGQHGSGATHFKAITDFLKSEKNQPKTVKEIVAATGIARNSVNYVLYIAHKADFEKVESEGVRNKRWKAKVSKGGNSKMNESAQDAQEAR